MSLADDAKLLLIPTGYKTSKVYSVFPTDGDGDFDYTRSGDASRVNPGGLIETVGTNIPRIDHLGGGCPTLNLEPQRTNLFRYSEEYDQPSTYWNKIRFTISADAIISPNGTLTADEVFETADNNNRFLYQNISVTSGNDYSISFFVKYNNIQYLQLASSTGFSGSEYVNFDIINGTITKNFYNTVASIEQYSNGWFRISMTETSSTTTTGRIVLASIPSGTSNRLPGYIGNTSNSFYLWGGQMEQGYHTSYIKTEASAVTRLKDECHLLNQTLFTDYPFTVYAKAKVESVGNTIFSIVDSTNANKYLTFNISSSTQVAVFRRDTTNNDADYYNFSYSIGDTIKVAVAFISDTAYKLYVNGTELADVTSGLFVPFDHNDIALGQLRIASDTGTRNSIDDFRVYDYTLTDAELTELTTL